MIGEPLALPGVVHWRAACPLPAVAVTGDGANGAPTVIDPLGCDRGPVPTALTPATLNVYVPPFVRPVMVCLVAVELNDRVIRATPP